jgi:hypothetical protein
MKRLYERTNKRDATKQIGQHVVQLEHAQLAAEQQTTSKRSKTQTTSVDDDIDQDLEKHYQVSKSQKNHKDLYGYIYANQGNPAFNVSLRVPCAYPGVSIGVNHQ